MRCEGLVPDVITYNTVMDVCQKSGHWKLALQIFRQLLSGSHTAMIDVIDVITMNTAMGAYLRLGDSGRWSDIGRYDSEIDARVCALSSKRDVYNINMFIILAHPTFVSSISIHIYTILYLSIHMLSADLHLSIYPVKRPNWCALLCKFDVPNWHRGTMASGRVVTGSRPCSFYPRCLKSSWCLPPSAPCSSVPGHLQLVFQGKKKPSGYLTQPWIMTLDVSMIYLYIHITHTHIYILFPFISMILFIIFHGKLQLDYQKYPLVMC